MGDVSRTVVNINSSGDGFVTRVRETFQAAMADDPICRYIIKDGGYSAFWDIMIDKYIDPQPSSLNIALEGAEAGILACLYPTEAQVSTLTSILTMLKIFPCSKLSMALAAYRLDTFIDAGKNGYAREHGEYLYVFLVGTRPEHQGKGLGSALMRHLSDYADSRGLHCYLEASSEGSRRMYERHGYKEIEVFHMAKGAPPLYRMGRPPKAQQLAPGA